MVKKMIEIKELKKSFGKLNVLDNINLKINEGEIYGLVGKSGAGKSTLLRCINGLEKESSGKVIVNGTTISNLKGNELREYQKNIGMIFQNFALLERRDVYHNIALPMKMWKIEKIQIDERVKELLELVGIPEKIHEYPRTLSGGQKQRVAIARALAMNPKILLCDEATSALDPQTTQSILKLLRDINKQLGITIIVVTHQMSVVKQLCSKISILENGRIVETGLVEDMFLRRPETFERFLGEEENHLPKENVNIRILIPNSSEKSATLSRIILKFNEEVKIVDGEITTYREQRVGSFVFNISEEHIDTFLEVLKSEHVDWIVVDNRK